MKITFATMVWILVSILSNRGGISDEGIAQQLYRVTKSQSSLIEAVFLITFEEKQFEEARSLNPL